MESLKEKYDIHLTKLRKAISKTVKEEMRVFAKNTGSHVTSISVEMAKHYRVGMDVELYGVGDHKVDGTFLSNIKVNTTMDE